MSTVGVRRYTTQIAGSGDDGGQRINSIMSIAPCSYRAFVPRQRCQATGDNSIIFFQRERYESMMRCGAAAIYSSTKFRFLCATRCFLMRLSVHVTDFIQKKKTKPIAIMFVRFVLLPRCRCCWPLFQFRFSSSIRTANDAIIRHSQNNWKRRCYI